TQILFSCSVAPGYTLRYWFGFFHAGVDRHGQEETEIDHRTDTGQQCVNVGCRLSTQPGQQNESCCENRDQSTADPALVAPALHRAAVQPGQYEQNEIGRASCRERG